MYFCYVLLQFRILDDFITFWTPAKSFCSIMFCFVKVDIANHQITNITAFRLRTMLLNVPVQCVLCFVFALTYVTLPILCLGVGKLFVIVNIHHKFVTHITLSWSSLMALQMFIQVACPVLFEHLVANWTWKNFFLMLVIIEDYDRMIRIILLTTIPCTHLDIVHSSQYV